MHLNLRHLTLSLGLIAPAAIAIAGCGGSSSAATAKKSPPAASGAASAIAISNFAFEPHTLTVSKGTRITVTNNDGTTHTATADDGHPFDTGDIGPGSTATVTLSTAGTYTYDCSIHPYMHGTIIVR